MTADKCVDQPCNIIGDRINFITIGDWGGTDISPYTTEIQRKVAENLNQVAIKENVHFYIDTGDHFYPKGVKNVEDLRFQVRFFDVKVITKFSYRSCLTVYIELIIGLQLNRTLCNHIMRKSIIHYSSNNNRLPASGT